ncbi:succinate dehydrogenase assembly factor 2, mitochondrial-like [Asterias rubens]|uniref:succinate dehydrogenase assembly factor 2, mitochondrial-like n=1 Tax=Asterias rubens TaxID=7604 RepID=UPI0014559064|nr:succinate dehydrogenase assembly factor 2, mitochondrial-like [Asterias rubens]
MAASIIARTILAGSCRKTLCFVSANSGHLRPLHRLSSSGPPIDPPPTEEISIPEWKQPVDEAIELQRARLLYQSRKRGMLENGLLLSTFAARYLPTFDKTQLEQYDFMINKPDNDWDIFHWVTDHKPTPEEFKSDVMDLLKKHVSNVNMESRIRQPDLPEDEIRQ